MDSEDLNFSNKQQPKRIEREKNRAKTLALHPTRIGAEDSRENQIHSEFELNDGSRPLLMNEGNQHGFISHQNSAFMDEDKYRLGKLR